MSLDLRFDSFQRRASALLLACAFVACSKSSPGTAATGERPDRAGKADDSAAGSLDLGGGSYKVEPLSAVGSVSGTITLKGEPPVDSTQLEPDDPACGSPSEDAVETTAKGGLSNAVVWVADAKAGKALPNDKRIELASAHCAVDPRVQGAVTGSTVNVFNDDRVDHKLVFLRAGTHDTITKMPFYEDGEVVASEVLAKKPGIVEVRCAIHPNMRGYLAVFDHPYFAVTEHDGTFKIDSLPPGTYTMMVWHEGMSQPASQRIQVAANGRASLDLAVSLGR
jgi:plastocyanin